MLLVSARYRADYGIALEGMACLLEQDPTYTGIKPPYNDKRLSLSGFADETCLSVSDKLAVRTAIERILTCFQKASGNEGRGEDVCHIAHCRTAGVCHQQMGRHGGKLL